MQTPTEHSESKVSRVEGLSLVLCVRACACACVSVCACVCACLQGSFFRNEPGTSVPKP